MSEMKPTPGPWVMTEGKCIYINAKVDGKRRFILQRSTGEGCGINVEAEQVRADCRLIAAAPELLEALQAVLRSFPTDRDMRDAGWERAEIDLACRDYEAARAAISKALPN